MIYNGVDLEKFSPSNRSTFRPVETRGEFGMRNETLFFLLAHNLALKNAATLIRAMGLLARKNTPAHLLIAGGDKTAPYVRLAAQCGAASRVTFLGMVDPVRYFAAADVAVLPTWYDPCSLFTLEAWSAGLPVITTQYNGASELMSSGSQGVSSPIPPTMVALANAIFELLDEKQRARTKMSESARALALEHSFEKQADEFIALYQEIKDAKR